MEAVGAGLMEGGGREEREGVSGRGSRWGREGRRCLMWDTRCGVGFCGREGLQWGSRTSLLCETEMLGG